MATFKGQSRHRLDPKGRVAIPARMRRSDGGAHDRFVLAPGLDGCVYAFPPEEWRKVEERLRGMSFERAAERRYVRLMLARAEDVDVDRQGRVIVPGELLTFAKLKDEVLIVGVSDHLELWNPDSYGTYAADGPTYEAVAEQLLG